MVGRVAGTDKIGSPTGVANVPGLFQFGLFLWTSEAKVKNRYVKAGMELATRQRELGQLLDSPAETRAADFDSQLTAAKANIAQAQSAVELAALAEPDIPEHRQDGVAATELRSMIDASNVGDMFDAILAHAIPARSPRGATAALRTTGESDPHLSTGDPGSDTCPVERGADRAGNRPLRVPTIGGRFLGVDMPTVGVGESVWPVLSGTLDVHYPAENAAAAETTGAFTAELLSPSRIQSSYLFSREDQAKILRNE